MLKHFAAFKRLSVLYNYFDGAIKLFSDLYLVKFLDASTKPFFLCRRTKKKIGKNYLQ